MSKKMSIFGIGHKAGIPTIIYLGVTYWLTTLYPNLFSYPDFAFIQAVRVPKGIFLLGVGAIILVLSAGHLIYAYSRDQLAKTGFFRLVANPLYANAVVFLIPGFSLLINSWLVLTSSIVLYVLYRKYVPVEYAYLREKFGKEYEDYYNSIIIKWL